MKAKSIKGNSPSVIAAALTEHIKDGYRPTLAVVFITAVEHMQAICSLLTAHGIAVFGVSTSQNFTEAGIESEDIVLLLLDIDPTCFKIVLRDYSELSAFESARQIGEIGKDAFKNPAFIISAIDFKVPGEYVINGLVDAVGEHATIIGGMGGEPVNFSGIVFTNQSVSACGLLALILDQDKIDVSGIAVSGWKPVGTVKQITKSAGPWVYTIDNEPAMDVINKYLGYDIAAGNPHEGIVVLNDAYPLQVQRESGTPMMRPTLLWNTADQSVMLGGQAKEGARFRFSLPPDFDVIETVVESSKMMKEKEMPDADALIVFSCIGRLGSLGPMLSTEIEGLAATWNKPMIGFFSLGEFGKVDQGQCEFHGTTVSWVALKEKAPSAT